MLYLDKLHLAENENLVLAKSICCLIEYLNRIITQNEFETSYKLVTTFQLSNADFLLLLSKYACITIPDCTKVPSSTIISNVVATYLRKFTCVCKFVSVMFVQNIRSPSYRVVKRCGFYLVS